MSVELFLSEKFNADVWRMEIDELSDTLFIETRDNADKKVLFSAVDLSTGKVFFKDLNTLERWLTGIEAAYGGIMLLHFYQTESGPAHRGLMAINGITGKALWSDYSLSVDYMSVNGPIVYDARVQPRKLFLADINTGATTRIYEPYVYKAQKNSILYPELMEADELAQKLIHKHPFGKSVHYLDFNNYRIVSLHALKGGELIQMIYIFDERSQIFEDILNSGIQKIQPEAFIVYKNRLIYIKNRSALKILSL
jgi:hypothetical protein